MRSAHRKDHRPARRGDHGEAGRRLHGVRGRAPSQARPDRVPALRFLGPGRGVTQIALAKLYAAWPRVQRQDGPGAHARKIIARTAIDEWRRPWRRELVIGEALADLQTTVPPVDVGNRLLLRAALAQLPARQRQVVVLRHYWGLSVEEVAHDLGISSGSVKSHCSRAIRRLNELMSESQEAVI